MSFSVSVFMPKKLTYAMLTSLTVADTGGRHTSEVECKLIIATDLIQRFSSTDLYRLFASPKGRIVIFTGNKGVHGLKKPGCLAFIMYHVDTAVMILCSETEERTWNLGFLLVSGLLHPVEHGQSADFFASFSICPSAWFRTLFLKGWSNTTDLTTFIFHVFTFYFSRFIF